MGSGVKEISFYSFNRSEFQGTLKIGENVTTIEKGAFKQCKFTGDLIIPDNVELIKEEAFHSTNFTGNLQIGNGIEDIPEKAFQNCNMQGALTIGNGVKTIGNYAFYGSNFQGSFTMGKNVTSIGTSAFRKLWLHARVNHKRKRNTIGIRAFANSKFTPKIFTSGLQPSAQFTIPNKVTIIETEAFLNCSGLTPPLTKSTSNALVIGSSVEYIGDHAFTHYDKTTSQYLSWDIEIVGTYAQEPLRLGANVFGNGEKIRYLRVRCGANSLSKYKYSDWGNYFFNIQE